MRYENVVVRFCNSGPTIVVGIGHELSVEFSNSKNQAWSQHKHLHDRENLKQAIKSEFLGNFDPIEIRDRGCMQRVVVASQAQMRPARPPFCSLLTACFIKRASTAQMIETDRLVAKAVGVLFGAEKVTCTKVRYHHYSLTVLCRRST
ncbi:hypothetical protein BDR06DRAFT_715844 [Suillus hirtellus]|nr:hypothetical protein BDR06DRAFT_715844 [Suillus hirtellus]